MKWNTLQAGPTRRYPKVGSPRRRGRLRVANVPLDSAHSSVLHWRMFRSARVNKAQ